MKKFLSIMALLTAFLFVGGTAQAAPAYPDQATCEAAGNAWDNVNGSCFPIGDNADGIDCPGGPQYNVTECQPVATPVPESPAVVPPPAAEPVPVAPAPVPVPEPLPVPAVDQPVERTELAYTGFEDVVLATVGLAVGLGGVALVRYSLKMRRESDSEPV